MDPKELKARIEQANSKMVGMDPEPQQQQEGAYVPVDLYQKSYNERLEANKIKRPNGSSPRVTVALPSVISNVEPRYCKAKNDSEFLANHGDVARSRMVKEQYMDEVLLPAVETMVTLFGADEVLNNDKAIETLDKFVLIDGGRGKGYVSSFIKTLHAEERGATADLSDAAVMKSVKQIRDLVAKDEIRTAVGVATNMKKLIDSGANIASQDDYELIQKVALRGM